MPGELRVPSRHVSITVGILAQYASPPRHHTMLRSLAIFALLLICGAGAAAARRPVLAAAPPMAFYVAQGAPDACGSGCDSWIAVEGQIDANAAARFRTFLQRNKAVNLPMYFSSPGGNLDQALEMGAILRERPVIARVARTVVRECGFEAQDSEICVRLKQSGRQLHGELFTRDAMCNSACPYLILGASSREIAPDALLAVHTPKVILSYRGETPSAAMRAAANERGLDRANRILANYLPRMGVSLGLLDLAKTVPFESPRVLTREEIARFRIDGRALSQTAWTFVNAVHPYVRKIALVQKPDGTSFQTMEWRLFCANRNANLMFIREVDKAVAGTRSVMLMAGTQPLDFGSRPARLGKFEAWNGWITTTAMSGVLAASHWEIQQGISMPDGNTKHETLDIDTLGLPPTWARLFETCPNAAPRNVFLPVPGAARPLTVAPVPVPPT
jgi:hypothetical protein